MFTVALIGGDGAGKTTIGRRLERTLPLPVKYIYMGDNPASSNFMLPTTRLILALFRAVHGKAPDSGPPTNETEESAPPSRSAVKRLATSLKSSVGLVNHIGEEWYRQIIAWYYQCRGNIVLFDRHFFFDYYMNDIAPASHKRSFRRRIHGWVLNHLYPRPDLVIYLDAPAEVLFARKGEGTIPYLERRRQHYLQMEALVKHYRMVDASLPTDEVACDVSRHICDFYQARRGKMKKARHE